MSNSYIGENIPKLGFGLMRLPMVNGDVDIEQTKKMVDYFIEKGFTYFDTAYPYINEKSEIITKEVLVKRYPRSSYQLATKMPVWLCNTYEDFQPLFDEQLEKTGATYFDFYLLHALNKDRMKHLDEINAWDFMKQKKEEGLIKHIGFSFHDTADVLDEYLTKHEEVEFVQLQINYTDWEDERIQSRLCYEVARKHNKPIIIMEPVKGGNLASMAPNVQQIFKSANPEMSVASWAIRYAASLDGIITVLSGMSNMEQLIDNTNFMADFQPINDDEKNTINKVLDELSKVDTVPCTTCKYCVEDCPQKINIPGIFSAYNTYKIYQNLDAAKGNYNWVTSEGKASDCIACGACEGHCPQHIKIIDTLKEAAKKFDN